MTTNQTSRTGPKTTPIPEVPLNWIANSAVRSPMVIGTTISAKAGVATCRPSTAETTLMAGVIMPSPNSNPAPSISAHSSSRMPRFLCSCSRPYSANRPPSPSFCARKTKMAYLMATMAVIVQITSETPPSTSAGVCAAPARPKNNASMA